MLVLAGCSSGTGGASDASNAGEPDAAADDGPLDAGAPDAAADDGGPLDAGDAAGGDGLDTDGDGGPIEPWSWCPDASAYHGGSWDWTIQAGEAAVYCVYCSPSADSARLALELQRKAELRVVPGDYPIPPDVGEYAFRLPVCLRFVEPDTQPLIADPGLLTVSQSLRNGVPYLHFLIEQPLQTRSGEGWLFKANLVKPAEDGQTRFSLDGSFPGPTAELAVAMQICELPCGYADDVRELASCRFDGVPPERHRLVFAGGEIDLRLRISPGYTMVGQLPALFERAEGDLDGQPFQQADYWKLAFTGGIQHYLNRHFLLLFDQPIGAACGLKAENLDVFCSAPPARLATVGCDLAEIEQRQISEESWEELP